MKHLSGFVICKLKFNFKSLQKSQNSFISYIESLRRHLKEFRKKFYNQLAGEKIKQPLQIQTNVNCTLDKALSAKRKQQFTPQQEKIFIQQNNFQKTNNCQQKQKNHQLQTIQLQFQLNVLKQKLSQGCEKKNQQQKNVSQCMNKQYENQLLSTQLIKKNQIDIVIKKNEYNKQIKTYQFETKTKKNQKEQKMYIEKQKNNVWDKFQNQNQNLENIVNNKKFQAFQVANTLKNQLRKQIRRQRLTQMRRSHFVVSKFRPSAQRKSFGSSLVDKNPTEKTIIHKFILKKSGQKHKIERKSIPKNFKQNQVDQNNLLTEYVKRCSRQHRHQ